MTGERIKRVDLIEGFNWRDDLMPKIYAKLLKELPTDVSVYKVAESPITNTFHVYLTCSNWDIITKLGDIPVISIQLNEDSLDTLEFRKILRLHNKYELSQSLS